ncbi:MAG: CotH kinase family protein [Candidatus Krumholzibacteriota bacterium]|nr:CotH kinase family protein [Candidatus Krumholzibacteriota bacterium]
MRNVAGFAALALLALPAAALAEQPVYAVNAGGQAYTDSHGILFSADLPYAGNGFGYVGGTPYAPSHVENNADWSCDDPGLHYEQRGHLDAYRFDLPAGDYVLRLYWLEGAFHGPRLRLMDVSLEGDLVFDDLDLAGEAGFMHAWEVSRLVSVDDGTLDVEFESPRGWTTLSALAVWEADDPGVAPRIPEGFEVMDGFGMNVLRWDVADNVALRDMAVYRAASAGGPFYLHDVVEAGRGHCYDWSAAPGQTGHYRIAARDVWGREGDPTDPLAATALDHAHSDLTVFRLYMAQGDYDSLNAHPLDDDYYPAYWGVADGPVHAIEARYRGGMARFFEKKSWKLELPGSVDYNGWSDLHLVGNPDDPFIIRNQVCLRMFDDLAPWSSATEYIHLTLWDEYRGVFDLAEEVDRGFLVRRGVTQVGNLYKANADMRPYATPEPYIAYYKHKAGPDESHADLIDFIENVNHLDDCDLPPYLAATLDVANFNAYYAMIVYTRQYDFICRNYYLYHDAVTGLWSLIPWDMTLSFHWDALPLDFGTAASPHFWDGSWNRLIDRVLGVPRLRWAYAECLDSLAGAVLNRPAQEARVDSLFGAVLFDGRRDVFKAWHDDNETFDQGGGLVLYRMGQRDAQLETMLPAFKAAIPVICINEHQNVPPARRGREGDSWLEIVNYGDRSVMGSDLELTVAGVPGSGWTLPAQPIQPGARRLIHLDGGGGTWHATLEPDSAGGTWVLLGDDGAVWDQVRYGAAVAPGYSEGRQPDGWITWNGMPATPDAPNSPLAPPEIMTARLYPPQPMADDTLRVEVEAVDPGGRPLAVTFYARLGDGPVDSLALSPAGGTLFAGDADPVGAAGALHWWVRAVDDLGLAATDPVAAPFYYHTALVMDGSLPLFLNEFMALNDTTIVDEHGDYEDWVELYNAGEVAIDLAGFFLTDDLEEPAQWCFPADTACVIGPGEWLLVWTDDDDEHGPLHTNFKLDGDGEELAVLLPDTTLLDYVAFGAQQADVSYGRVEDGGGTWGFLPKATPGWSNEDLIAAPDTPAPPALALDAWPNPFNPAVTLRCVLPGAGPATLDVFDVAGRRVRRLAGGDLPAGAHEAVWRGRDDAGRRCAAGIYLVRLQAGGRGVARKILLLK